MTNNEELIAQLEVDADLDGITLVNALAVIADADGTTCVDTLHHSRLFRDLVEVSQSNFESAFAALEKIAPLVDADIDFDEFAMPEIKHSDD